MKYLHILAYFTAFCVLLVISIAISTLIYSTFYFFWIPKIAHEKPVFFRFERSDQGISALGIVDFTDLKFNKFLSYSQPYDVNIELSIPRSPHNRNLGNFMINLNLIHVASPDDGDLNLYNQKAYDDYVIKKGKIIYGTMRPAILPYKSKLVVLAETIVKLPLILTEFAEESQKLIVPLIENFYDSYMTPITHAAVEISAGMVDQFQILQIYRANIRIDAHFYGLRYLMYHLALPSAIVFISLMSLFLMLIFCSLALYYKYLLHTHANQVEGQAVSEFVMEDSEPFDYKEINHLPTPPPDVDSDGSENFLTDFRLFSSDTDAEESDNERSADTTESSKSEVEDEIYFSDGESLY